MERKILITDLTKRKVFDIYNILRRDFQPSDLILYSNTKSSYLVRIFFKILYYPSKVFFEQASSSSFQYLSELIRADEIVYLPIEEETTVAFLEEDREKSLKRNYSFCLPSLEVYNLVRDKLKLNLWCEREGIPSPKNIRYSENSRKAELIDVILKPRIGSGSRGIFQVKAGEVIDPKGQNLRDFVIQEKLPNGRAVKGCFILANEGLTLASYTHERIRTFPISGGVSVCSKFGKNQKLIEISEVLVKKLNFSGLLMLEFLFDERDKKYKLIEINPRVWGSFLLSEASGEKFLKNYVNLAVGRRVEIARNSSTPVGNLFIRWIFPYDLLRILSKYPGRIVYINFTYAQPFRALLHLVIIYPAMLIKKVFKGDSL